MAESNQNSVIPAELKECWEWIQQLYPEANASLSWNTDWLRKFNAARINRQKTFTGFVKFEESLAVIDDFTEEIVAQKEKRDRYEENGTGDLAALSNAHLHQVDLKQYLYDMWQIHSLNTEAAKGSHLCKRCFQKYNNDTVSHNQMHLSCPNDGCNFLTMQYEELRDHSEIHTPGEASQPYFLRPEHAEVIRIYSRADLAWYTDMAAKVTPEFGAILASFTRSNLDEDPKVRFINLSNRLRRATSSFSRDEQFKVGKKNERDFYDFMLWYINVIRRYLIEEHKVERIQPDDNQQYQTLLEIIAEFFRAEEKAATKGRGWFQQHHLKLELEYESQVMEYKASDGQGDSSAEPSGGNGRRRTSGLYPEGEP